MKKFNFIKIFALLVIFLSGSVINLGFAQNTEKSDKEMKIKIIKEVDGKTTVIDTIISSDLDFDAEDLNVFIKMNKNNEELDSIMEKISFAFKFDDDSLLSSIKEKVISITSKIDSKDFDFDFDFDFDIDKDAFEKLEDLRDLKFISEDNHIKIITSDDNKAIVIITDDEDGEKEIHEISLDVFTDDDSEIYFNLSKADRKSKIKKISIFGDDDKKNKYIKQYKDYKYHNIDIRDINNSEKLKALGISPKNNKLEISKIKIKQKEENQIQLRFELKTKGKTTIELMNINGKEIFKEKVKYFPGIYDKTIDVSGFDNEKFILHIAQGDSSVTKKIALN